MKDFTKEQLEASRPGYQFDAIKLIDLTLKACYVDKEHYITDDVAAKGYWTYEELIGTLLLAKDEIEELRESVSELQAIVLEE